MASISVFYSENSFNDRFQEEMSKEEYKDITTYGKTFSISQFTETKKIEFDTLYGHMMQKFQLIKNEEYSEVTEHFNSLIKPKDGLDANELISQAILLVTNSSNNDPDTTKVILGGVSNYIQDTSRGGQQRYAEF